MSPETIFNFEDTLARLDHDTEMFQMLVKLFLEQGPKDLADIQAALTAKDARALARSAHRLKGAVLQFCSPSLLEATKELEGLGNAGNLQSAVTVCATLETGLCELFAALRHLLEKGPAS